MANIFVMHYNCKRHLNEFIRLFANIYQYKVDSIILPNSVLCVSHKKDAQVQFSNFKIKTILK